MANFFVGLLRANSKMYGDLEGEITNLNKGRLSISIIKGKCIAWIVGQPDIELSKENVKTVESISRDNIVDNFPSNAGKKIRANVYRITLTNGKTGILRLAAGDEYKVLQLIK